MGAFARVQTENGIVDHLLEGRNLRETFCWKTGVILMRWEGDSDFRRRRLCKRCAAKARSRIAELEGHLVEGGD